MNMKKNLKEFIPLIKLVKEDLNKIILASIVIFISGITDIFTGYLNGKVVSSGTHNELLKTSDIYKNLYETESLNS
jgi:ABC-type enterochelin transport system ATPase subunit